MDDDTLLFWLNDFSQVYASTNAPELRQIGVTLIDANRPTFEAFANQYRLSKLQEDEVKAQERLDAVKAEIATVEDIQVPVNP